MRAEYTVVLIVDKSAGVAYFYGHITSSSRFYLLVEK